MSNILKMYENLVATCNTNVIEAEKALTTCNNNVIEAQKALDSAEEQLQRAQQNLAHERQTVMPTRPTIDVAKVSKTAEMTVASVIQHNVETLPSSIVRPIIKKTFTTTVESAFPTTLEHAVKKETIDNLKKETILDLSDDVSVDEEETVASKRITITAPVLSDSVEEIRRLKTLRQGAEITLPICGADGTNLSDEEKIAEWFVAHQERHFRRIRHNAEICISASVVFEKKISNYNAFSRKVFVLTSEVVLVALFCIVYCNIYS